MNVGRFALKALGWIGKVVGLVQTPAGKIALNGILGYVLGEKAMPYMRKLEKLEEGYGAHTRVWNKVVNANRGERGLELTYEEVRYLFWFKRHWDNYIKEPLRKVTRKLNK
jgi:xanthosine utilization system XapX-like protein